MPELFTSNEQFRAELVPHKSQLERLLMAHPRSQKLHDLGVPVHISEFEEAVAELRAKKGWELKYRWLKEVALHRELVHKSVILELQAVVWDPVPLPAFTPESSSQLLGGLEVEGQSAPAAAAAVDTEAASEPPTVSFWEHLIIKEACKVKDLRIKELDGRASTPASGAVG